jgi:hypothetical protein
VVTNGMSQYSRNERNANSGIVVGITPIDYPGGPLAGIELQERLESHAYVLGGSNYEAPAQLVGDFIAGKPSTAGQRRAVLQAGRAWATWPWPAGLRHRSDPRSLAGVREADPRLLAARCGADRDRDAHLVAAAHHP